jgi:hypothetical protein
MARWRVDIIRKRAEHLGVRATNEKEFTTPHDTVSLPVHDLVVPAPVAEHIFDLLP